MSATVMVKYEVLSSSMHVSVSPATLPFVLVFLSAPFFFFFFLGFFYFLLIIWVLLAQSSLSFSSNSGTPPTNSVNSYCCGAAACCPLPPPAAPGTFIAPPAPAFVVLVARLLPVIESARMEVGVALRPRFFAGLPKPKPVLLLWKGSSSSSLSEKSFLLFAFRYSSIRRKKSKICFLIMVIYNENQSVSEIRKSMLNLIVLINSLLTMPRSSSVRVRSHLYWSRTAYLYFLRM